MKAKAKFLTCALALAGIESGLSQNPLATIQFSSRSYSVAEDAGNALITVLRTGDTNSVVTVDFATSDGTAKAGEDYAAQSGTLRFTAGETSKTLSISILDDGSVEGDETLNLTLSKSTGGATLGLQKNALLTIGDNELRARLLDISFNPDVSGTSSSSFALQNDGKILWTGSFADTTTTNTIVRLNPDGSLDSQLKFTTEQKGRPASPTLVLAPMPDGKILIGGSFTNVGTVSRRMIARLNSDGSLDGAFDPGLGAAGVLNQDANPRVEVIALQPDGKAIVGGVFSRFNGQSRGGLARLNVDGSLDTNFNAQVNVSPGAITLLPNGKLLVGGGFTTVDGKTMGNIARLNADGTLDTSFHSKFIGGGSVISTALQPDGKVIIGGSFTKNGTTFSPIARLNPDGAADTNFVTGFIGDSLGHSGVVFTVGLQTDGKIVISGSFSMVGDAPRSNVARLLPDGSVDRSFNFPLDNFPMTVVVQPDDDILFGGNFSVVEGINRSGMVRVHGHPERVYPIEFTSAQYSVSEGAGAAVISVERAGDTTSAVSVDYATSDGTATGGLDYSAQSGTLTFAPLEVTKTINVPILADALVEGDETVAVRLSNPSSGAHLGEKANATLTIRDDDKAPQFVADSLFVNEHDGVAGIILRRSGDLRQAITLDYSTSDGTGRAGKDYTAQKGAITFAPGAATQTINIPILDNGAVDGPRTVNVTVSNSTVFPNPSTATLTIADNEQQVLFDPSFASNQAAFGPGGYYPCIQAVSLLPDGKIMIGGCFTNVGGLSRGGIARLNGDGSLDLSFDPGSGVSGGSGDNAASGPAVFSVALQSDKVILGGSFFRVDGRIYPGLARLNADGTLDETFQAGVGALGRGYPDVRQVIVQGDEKILFAGYFTDGPGVARLNADGSLDATFHSAQPQPGYGLAAIALQADGKILVDGTTYSSDGGHPYLVRLSADGSLDTPFRLVPPALLGLNSSISAMALQLDGKVLASGNFSQSDGNSEGMIFRLNADGSLDPTFNAGPMQDSYMRQILVLASGKVLAIGYPRSVRLNADGSLDRSFELGDATAVALRPDGFIIAAGPFAGGLARIFPDLGQTGGSEFTMSVFSVPETIGTAMLNVQRLGDSSQEMTVDFTTSDGTARAGLDYVAQTGTVRFAPLQVTNAISIAIINDGLVEAEKSFQVTLSNPSSSSSLQLVRAATVVITSNDTGIQFVTDTFRVGEADGFAEVLVTRSGEGLSAAAVDYFTSDGTAKAGADYLARGGTITFAPGKTNQTIQIPILDDGWVEGNETIHLALANPRAGAMLGTRTNATLVIVDNEIPTWVDPSFDSGKGATDDSGNPQDILAVIVQPDGKIVIGGNFTQFNGAARTGVARLNPDGSVDASFRPPHLGFSGFHRMSVQPDGKVLFFYYLNGGSPVVGLLRLGADGSSDPSFRSTRFESGSQYGNNIQAVVLQPDGKILVGGTFGRVGGVAQKNLARLNADGTLDTAFKVDVGPSTLMNGNEATIVLQPDGKILISGQFNSINGTPVNGSARLNADGSLDATFSLSDYSGSSLFLATQPDGKILVQQDRIARLNPDGSKDASFNAPNAYVSLASYGGYRFALQADGKILFIGTFRENDSSSRDGLYWLNPDGSLDTTLATLELGYAEDYSVRQTAFALQADGKILVVGNFISVNGIPRAGLVRLFGDLNGTPDISFTTASASVSESAALAAITIQRLGDTSQPASVHYTTQDGTALANLNYLPTSGTLDFAPLENEKTIIVPIFDDELPSADTSLSLTLSNPSDGTIVNAGLNTTTLIIADGQRPGSVDFSFNPLIETTNDPASGFHLALQPDGKVIVAGDFQRVNGVSRNGICRLNPDGSLDMSFDPNGGLATLPDGFGNLSPVYSLALQSDGKVLVRGSFDSVNGMNYTNFVRLNADGSVDTHFVPDAAAQARSFYDRGGGMAVQPDGRILVAESGGCCGIKPVELGRLAADGLSDPTFVTLEVVGASSGWGSTFNVIIVQGDGSVLFEGNVDPPTPNIVGPGQGMTRLNADGSLDASFHPVMDKLIDGDGGSRNAAVVQPDGKIVMAGLFNQVNGVDRPGLARLNPDGSTDPSFVPESRVTENNDTGSYNIRALALQTDGKILAASGDGSLVRLNADGSRDLTFVFALDKFKQNGFTDGRSDIVVQPDGQILFAGNFTSANGSARPSLVRLNGDAGLANSRARFRSITGPGAGKLQLTLDVIPHRTYAIEASTDLTNWTAVTTRNATNYLLNVTDSVTSFSNRFYRAVQTVP